VESKPPSAARRGCRAAYYDLAVGLDHDRIGVRLRRGTQAHLHGNDATSTEGWIETAVSQKPGDEHLPGARPNDVPALAAVADEYDPAVRLKRTRRDTRRVEVGRGEKNAFRPKG
jgi:hypothetical protein